MARRGWESMRLEDERSPGDELLERLGLMRKSEQAGWMWPALGGVAVGLAAGVAIGMAFTPRRRELPARLNGRDQRAGIAAPPG